MLNMMIMMVTIKLIFVQVAFDTYELPGSGKASVSDFELTTNVGKFGRWMFRVDGIPLVPDSIFNQGLSDDIIHKLVLTCVVYNVIAIHVNNRQHMRSSKLPDSGAIQLPLPQLDY